MVKQNDIAVDSYIARVEKELNGSVSGTKEKEKIRISKPAWIIIISGIFLFFLIAGIFRYYRYQWKVTEQTVFYEKEHKLMAKNLETMETKEVAELTFDHQSYRTITNLQKEFVFYKDMSKELYYVNDIENKLNRTIYSIYKQDTNDWSKKYKCIEQNIVAHTWSKDGNLFYMKVAQDTLYKYNGRKIEQIEIKNMHSIVYVPSLDRLLITQNNTEGDLLDGIQEGFSIEEKVVGKDKFYLVNPETLEIEDLGVIPEEEYSFTSDYKHLYMLCDNQILDYDLSQKTSVLLMNNVYDFRIVNDHGKDRLYYISYTLKKKALYSCYKDPYCARDEQVKQKSELEAKETPEEKRMRKAREEFRKELKSQIIAEYSGTLYSYEEGQSIKIADGIGGFEKNNQSAVGKPVVYKTGKIDWTGYIINEDVYSETQRSLASLSEEEYEGENSNHFSYAQLVEYTELGQEPTQYECVKGKATDDYVVENEKIEKVQSQETTEYAVSASYQECQGIGYEAVIENDEIASLYKTEGQNEKTRLLSGLIEYYTTKYDTVIAVVEENEQKWNLYQLDAEGKKEVIEEKVDGVFAQNIWSLKEGTVTMMEE